MTALVRSRLKLHHTYTQRSGRSCKKFHIDRVDSPAWLTYFAEIRIAVVPKGRAGRFAGVGIAPFRPRIVKQRAQESRVAARTWRGTIFEIRPGVMSQCEPRGRQGKPNRWFGGEAKPWDLSSSFSPAITGKDEFHVIPNAWIIGSGIIKQSEATTKPGTLEDLVKLIWPWPHNSHPYHEHSL